MIRYGINLSLRLLLVWLLFLLHVSAGAAQETPPCDKPLSVQDVVDLLEGGVPGARVDFLVISCGVAFELNADLEQRLRSAGATGDLIRTIGRNVKIPAPKVTLRANKTEIQVGESVTLTWESSNATELGLEPDLGSVPLQGSRTVTLQKTTTYRLSARGKGGTAEGSVRVSVKSPPPMVTLQADRGEIARGQTVTLRWESSNATELTLEPGPGKIGASGSHIVSPQRTTHYRLVARGPGGEAERTLRVSVFNPNPDYKLQPTITAHLTDVKSVTFSPDGRTVASGDRYFNIALWDVATGRLLRTLEGHAAYAYAAIPSHRIGSHLAFSPDGSLLATGGGSIKKSGFLGDMLRMGIGKWQSPVDVFDVESGRLLHTLAGHRGSTAVYCVAFTPDGSILASGGDGIRLWDVPSRRLLRTLKCRWVMSVAFSPDGRLLASNGDGDSIELWEVFSNLHRRLKGHRKSARSVAFNPDGRLLASGSGDKSIKIWDVVTGRQVRTLKGHTGAVESVAFSPDGRLLASGSEDYTIKLWDVSTGRLLRTLEGHGDDVESVAFSPDGRMLASGSDDDTIKLWRRVED